MACGSQVLDRPLSRFPLTGASRGHRRLRYAAARAKRRPKPKAANGGLGLEGSWILIDGRGSAPDPINLLCETNRTFHLLIKPDILTCCQHSVLNS